jgi:hypothetical protein
VSRADRPSLPVAVELLAEPDGDQRDLERVDGRIAGRRYTGLLHVSRGGPHLGMALSIA